MKKIKGIDLKQLVEECEVEFEKEKPFRKAQEEMFDTNMSMRELFKNYKKKDVWMRPY